MSSDYVSVLCCCMLMISGAWSYRSQTQHWRSVLSRSVQQWCGCLLLIFWTLCHFSDSSVAPVLSSAHRFCQEAPKHTHTDTHTSVRRIKAALWPLTVTSPVHSNWSETQLVPGVVRRLIIFTNMRKTVEIYKIVRTRKRRRKERRVKVIYTERKINRKAMKR